MIIRTSYFSSSKLKELPKSYVKISIAGKKPDGFECQEFKKLAPKYSFFKEYKDGKINEEEYTKRYYDDVLRHLDSTQIIHLLGVHGSNIVLLCWESSDKFCHRHIVSNWMKKELDIEIEEL